METPCPKCGTLKTESVRHGLIYKFLWSMGYHLRRCSFCYHWRLQPRGDRNRPHPNDLSAEELTEHFNRSIAASLRRDAAMARIMPKASNLQPMAKPVAAATAATAPSPSAVGMAEPVVKPARVVSTSSPSVVGVTEPVVKPARIVSTSSPSAVGAAEMEPDVSYGSCPKCGNMKYRRSRRRWYERWLNRPKMARCLKCSYRYPHPD